MISASELLSLLTDLESDRVERTVSTTDMAKFSEAITAFANDMPDSKRPGYLLLGVRDNGTLSGLKATDELLRSLGGLRSDGLILPLPSIAVDRFVLEGGDVVVVETLPSDLPPVRYKGRVYVRIGPRRAIATEQDERILTERRVSSARTFDALPCPSASLRDLSLPQYRDYLNLAVAPEVLADNHRQVHAQMASLGFYDLKRDCPTNAAILVFGRDPRRHLAGAYVQFLRIDGTSLGGDIAGQEEISGDLASVLRQAESLAESHIVKRPEPVSAFRERVVRDYPMPALRELLANAVPHRSYESTAPTRFYWYSDRVEVQSPGGLYGEASRENFPNQNSYRNPVVAEALRRLGLVNRFGRGVFRAQEALRENGNPPAEFTLDPHYVKATIKVRQ